MKEKALTVEFRLPPAKTTPKPLPGAKAERLRQERAARKARNLGLGHWIDGLIRAGEAENLSAVASLCGVSKAAVTKVIELQGTRNMLQENVVRRGTR